MLQLNRTWYKSQKWVGLHTLSLYRLSVGKETLLHRLKIFKWPSISIDIPDDSTLHKVHIW